MKYLEHLGLENLSNQIEHCELGGGLVLRGRCEIYSTKRSTEEKKLAKQLESKMASSEPRSPADGTPKNSRESPEKALPHLNLIQTLNATQLDYDFSQLPPESFQLVYISEAVHTINNFLAELTVRSPNFLSDLWNMIDGAMDNMLQRCDVYRLADPSIIEDAEDEPVWSFHYFFCSKELKRVCYFRVHACSKFRKTGDYLDGDMDDDDDDEMDADGSMEGSKEEYDSEEDGY